ncbi:hypothetical protein F5141DRAFT_1068219 [Pisolithus sp. B1]|nr:hypothetical protein F5141DRAFT_1068219 [Pisolithus sp. B1]
MLKCPAKLRVLKFYCNLRLLPILAGGYEGWHPTYLYPLNPPAVAGTEHWISEVKMDNSQKLLQIMLPQFILSLLSSKKYENDPIVLGFTLQINNIIEVVNKYSETSKQNIHALVNKITMKMYMSKIKRIAAEGSGLHFDAACANVQQLEDFNIDELAWKMKGDTPYLWETLGAALLTHEEWRMGRADIDNQSGEDNEDECYDTLEGCNINLGELTGCNAYSQKTILGEEK